MTNSVQFKESVIPKSGCLRLFSLFDVFSCLFPLHTFSLLMQERYRQDCNLAVQLLKCNKSHFRNHKFADVSSRMVPRRYLVLKHTPPTFLGTVHQKLKFCLSTHPHVVSNLSDFCKAQKGYVKHIVSIAFI